MDPNSGSEHGGSGADGQGQEDRLSKEQVSKIVSDRVNGLNSEIAGLKGQLEAALNKTEAPKTYTRAELNQAVVNKEISEEEAQAVFDKQQAQQITDTAQATAQRVVTENQQTEQVQAQIQKYKDFDDQLLVDGSDSLMRIQREVVAQMGLSNLEKPTLVTELQALRVVYGPEENLGRVDERERQTHLDTQTGSDGKLPDNKDGSPKGLSQKERTYYQSGIDAGRYTGWDAVKEELGFADEGIRKRAAAR